MRKQAANYIRDEMATIDALPSHTPGHTNDIQQLTADLEAAVRRLAGG